MDRSESKESTYSDVNEKFFIHMLLYRFFCMY